LSILAPTPQSLPAKAGNPVITMLSVFTGSSACADDDSRECVAGHDAQSCG
jgi:hypothetical protein